jgi:hypothetical protein
MRIYSPIFSAFVSDKPIGNVALPHFKGDMLPEVMILLARRYAIDNLNQSLCADTDIPTPPAIEVSEWESDEEGGWFRNFTVSRTELHGRTVEVAGIQHINGTIDRYVGIAGNTGALTAGQTRDLAAALLAAAAELDRLNSEFT